MIFNPVKHRLCEAFDHGSSGKHSTSREFSKKEMRQICDAEIERLRIKKISEFNKSFKGTWYK